LQKQKKQSPLGWWQNPAEISLLQAFESYSIA